jgi:asparagine synthase (glutamine-hydrolysing)
MCGIAGAFRIKGVTDARISNMTDCLLHRGPDAGASYIDPDGKVYLGHRRLSIIDLSASANQPMYSSDGRYVIVFNGEIYNFPELKGKLPGFPWKTHGDTEVILELFAAFGPSSFAWLNGFFAFSIFDTETKKIYLCRDQIGIKPLFVQRNSEGLIWASELKAICEALPKTPAMERRAVAYFLHLGFIPEPLSIYEGIEKFPAGCWAVYDTNTRDWSLQRYWDARNHYLKAPLHDERKALQMYRDKLFAAVERQMISDVPLGTFLSGGIDSSLVSAVASKISRHKVNTFSIGFEEASHDEAGYAQKVADHLQTEHHLFRVKMDDILPLVPEFISVYDEPFADSSAFPTMLVSRLARKHVTVTLSGDGGDELFQGYGMYAWAGRLHKQRIRMVRKPLYQASRIMPERYRRAGRLFDYPDVDRIPSHIFSQEQYFFSEQELCRLLVEPSFDFSDLNRLPERGKPQERQAYWDLDHYLKDDLLVKVDRASMHYSLETRVPLLDQELIEFCLNLPLDLKVREGYGTKYLMKKVLYDLVPRPIFERPKRGFSIPLAKWLNGELQPLLREYLNEDVVREMNVVQPAYVSRLLQSFQQGEQFIYNRIWALLVLHWWYKTSKN